LLFDDMRGDVHDLAAQQLRVLDRVSHHFASGVDIVFCPTYYSSDPILERLFGQRPSAYWADLGKGLDSHIGVFWTGEKVCSESYSQSNLDSLCELMRRKLTLWDNYPVNDSRRLCDFLRLGAFENRHAWLRDYLNLHVTNPMNQAWLSLLPLSTLPAVYAESDTDQRQQAQALAWEQTLQFFGDQAAELLTGMGGAMALELSDWLQGRYAFDEACLTD